MGVSISTDGPWDRLWARVDKADPGGCWLWQASKDRDGYGHIRWNGPVRSVHLIVFTKFKGPIPEGLSVLHTCDIRACCNPAHLYLGTQWRNMRDRQERMKYVHGEAHPDARMTAEKVREARRLHESEGIGVNELARRYRITQQSMTKILRRISWKHIS